MNKKELNEKIYILKYEEFTKKKLYSMQEKMFSHMFLKNECISFSEKSLLIHKQMDIFKNNEKIGVINPILNNNKKSVKDIEVILF